MLSIVRTKARPYSCHGSVIDVPAAPAVLWYLVLVVLMLFIIKNPAAAGHLALMFGHLLSEAAGALSKLAGAI
jgi:uncharacterized membrane protein